MKHCRVCDTDKPLTEYYAHGGRVCKACIVTRVAKYYQANREKILAKNKDPEFKKKERELHAYKMQNDPKYRANHSAMRKRCRDKYKEKIRAYNLAYIKKNREILVAKKRAKRITEEQRKKDRAYVIAQRNNLTDVYIRQQLVKRSTLKVADIPQSLVEAKRLQLLIKNEVTNANKTM
jgi:hypothetical protein